MLLRVVHSFGRFAPAIFCPSLGWQEWLGTAWCHSRGKGNKVNWSEFFAMGGYAFYVWGAYISTAFIMFWEVISLVLRQRTQRREGLSDVRDD